MEKRSKYFVPLVILFAGVAQAQTVQVNPQNRITELSTQSSIELEADLVSITVGYQNYGATHDLAYDENTRAADQILKAWTADAFPKTIFIPTHFR